MRKNFKGNERLDEERLNYQGCLMRIIEYIDANNIIIEFQDEYMAKIHTSYGNFRKGSIKNPYFPSVCGVGMTGNKYPIKINGNLVKEYNIWRHMLARCFNKKFKEENSSYEDVSCCKEWLLFENFFEWLHSQENFDKWLCNDKWAIDKDILIKGNKIYSPETCCLVPLNVNNLFIKQSFVRGKYPIGVSYNENKKMFDVHCSLNHKCIYLGSFLTLKEAFCVYKEYKENIIKQVAQIEYDKGNITKECYEAMLNYKVEITD